MIVASSVFEYLVDVQRVAAGQGPAVRGRLAPDRSQSVWSRAQTRGLASVDPIEPPPFAYASQNSADRLLYHLPPAFAEPLPRQQWESVLTAAGFAALDRRDFSNDTWREQATAPLVLLTVKMVARA